MRPENFLPQGSKAVISFSASIDLFSSGASGKPRRSVDLFEPDLPNKIKRLDLGKVVYSEFMCYTYLIHSLYTCQNPQSGGFWIQLLLPFLSECNTL